MDIIAAIAAIISAHCVAVSANPSSDDFQKTVLQEVTTMLGKQSAPYRCDTRHGLRKPICSCDPSCSLYGDCCIDIASEVPRERYMCTQLERHGRYVWVRSSCAKEIRPRTKFMCEGPFTSNIDGLSFMVHVPVFHMPSQTLYRNIYCVLCNKGHIEEIYRWSSGLQWIGQAPPKDLATGKTSGHTIYDVERRVYGIEQEGIVYNATFRAAEFRWKNFTREFNTVKCSPVVDTCPEGSDAVLIRKCELYAAYYTRNNTSDVSYKNYHCALCNGVPLATVEEDYKLKRALKPLIPPSIVGTLKDVTLLQASGSYFQFLFDPSIADVGCDEHEIRVPGLNSCQPFLCPKGSRWDRSGKCIGAGGDHSCPWVVFEEQWVTILPNLSLYLNVSGEIVGPEDYEADTWKGHVLVCVSHPVTVVLDPTQEIIAEVCLALSTVCLLLLIAVYTALPHLRARAAGRAVPCLSMSLALAQALFLVGNDLPPHTTSCQLVAVVVHFSYLASFFWMNALAIDICRSLAIHVFDTGSEHLFLWYSGYAWLCPMLLVGVAVLLDVFLEDAVLSPNYGGNVCWICRRESLVAFFLAPVATLLIANAVLFIVTARSLRSSRLSVAANRRDDPGIPFLLYVKLVLAFGLTWVFGFAAALTPARWLWYPFIVMSGLQGAFLFVAFACKKTVFCALQQRYFPKKKKAGTESSSIPLSSTAVQPLVVRARHSAENSDTKVKGSIETSC